MGIVPLSTAPSAPPSRIPKMPAPGDRLGRFELVAAVAKGGMGTIWAARAAGGPIVALKTLHAEGAHDASLRDMFLDEARIAMACRHPNVCSVVEVGEDGGTLFLAMEWIEGDALHNVLVSGDRESAPVAFPEAVALRVVRRVCLALHAAHELTDPSGQSLGLVHRDVSPHNVLLSTSGAVKLIDFGIAKTRRRISQTTRSGVVKGKLRYMAPEQLDGGEVDRRADVWSLGAVLHLLASGEEVFADASEADVVRTLVMRDPLPAPTNPLPPRIRSIVERAMAFEPHDRYADTIAMAAAVEAALVALGEPVDDAHDVAVLASFARERVGVRVSDRQLEVENAVTEIDARPPLLHARPRRLLPVLVASAVVTVCALGGLALGKWQKAPAEATAAPPVTAVAEAPPAPPTPPAPAAPAPVDLEIVEAPAAKPTTIPTSKKPPRGSTPNHGKKAGGAFDHAE